LQELRNNITRSRGKYSRSLRAYTNTVNDGVILNLRDSPVQGFVQTDLSIEQDTAPTAQMSVIKSCIDTLVSKVASAKVRPYFTPINGSYNTVKVLKQTQIFFDDLYDRTDAVKKITMAFRDACIFDTGYLFVNPFDFSIMKISPWQASVLDAEYHYGKMTKALIVFEDVPKNILKNVYGIEGTDNYAKLEIFFDTEEGKAYLIAGGVEKKTANYNAPVPLVIVHYSSPVKGCKTTSITDDLYNIQWNINLLNARIKEAAGLSPANLILVPDGTNINVQNLDNRAGQVIRYKPIPGMGNPIEVSTPSFISTSYQQYLQFLINTAYEMTGISVLSAQSINPLGANASGAALQSMENIESGRFETQLNQAIRAYVDLAKLLIAMLPEDADILPAEANRSGYTWKDVKEQANLINIQYSAQTMLSKDPSKRLEQIMQLSQVGLIPQGKIGRFLEMPDLSEVFNIMTAAQDAVDKVIQLAVEDNYFEIPRYVSYDLLGRSITAMQNQLLGAYTKNNPETLLQLTRINQLDVMLQEILIKQGVIPIQQGEMQVSQNGIAAQGIQEAPGAVDAMNMGVPPETANDKNQWGEV
jgi:hypothetical protein